MKWCLTVPMGVFTGCLHIRLCRTPLNREWFSTVTTQFIKSHKNILTNQNTRKCYHMNNDTVF